MRDPENNWARELWLTSRFDQLFICFAGHCTHTRKGRVSGEVLQGWSLLHSAQKRSE